MATLGVKICQNEGSQLTTPLGFRSPAITGPVAAHRVQKKPSKHQAEGWTRPEVALSG